MIARLPAILSVFGLMLASSVVPHASRGPSTRRQGPAFVWRLPLGFPTPRVPIDNPMTLEKVSLGRHLFYDKRLSGNGRQSCATCHEQARAFTDGRARSLGSTGEEHPRSSMSLANVVYASVFGREDDAISPAARRGEQLFFSQPLSCFRCHGGFTFSGATDFDGRRAREPEFHNTGLYNLTGALSYPAPNTGVFDVTKKAEDIGKFKAPTLRNVAVTAPYMHDGSIASLEDVINHYAAGGRTIPDGPHRGIGHDNPNKSPLVQGFALTAAQKSDLIAFLQTLTDTELLHDPGLADPWH